MANFDTRNWQRGRLDRIDKLEHGDPAVGKAISAYSDFMCGNRQSAQFARVANWVENLLFSLGHHYTRDIIGNRIMRDQADGVATDLVSNALSKIPKPTNDFLGRYIETNISLLTENRPEPRVTAKGDDRADKQAAELSQLVIEYLWEKLALPEKTRDLARLVLNTGTSWLELFYDETQIRHMTVPQTQNEAAAIRGSTGVITLPVERPVPILDNRGRPVTGTQLEYGDMVANVLSPFEFYFPSVSQGWNSDTMGWVMKEQYMPLDHVKDRYGELRIKGVMTKANGWNLDAIKNLKGVNVYNLPLWWWERLCDAVEGPGPSIFVNSKEDWDDHVIVRTFDRKPNSLWPQGRTIITVNDQVLYDSPKKRGARAFNPRWPDRWHPYIRFRWEAVAGSTYGRSLVSKLLPKIKRVNAIDTTLIMWRRTVPIAAWIMPKGTNPVEGQILGRPGVQIQYDARQSNGNEPKPVYPPEYPRSIIEERSTQISEMEAIAGTEEVLRGERPQGVNSASMLSVLRKQALASRSAIIQSWDESLQLVGSAMLQEVASHVKADDRYAQRLKVLAREKASTFAIERFSGEDLSDNVVVRVDTASQAMVSREAQQQRAIEVLQYAQGLASLPPTLQAKIIDQLGWPDALTPKGADITRAQTLISFIKSNRFDLCIPFPEDDAYVLHEFLVEQLKKESTIDMSMEQVQKLVELIQYYEAEIQRIEMERIKFQQQMMMASTAAATPPEKQ